MTVPCFSDNSLTRQVSDNSVSLGRMVEVNLKILANLAFVRVGGCLRFSVGPSGVLFSGSSAPLITSFNRTRLLKERKIISSLPTLCPDKVPPRTFLSKATSIPFSVCRINLLLCQTIGDSPRFGTRVPPSRTLESRAMSKGFPSQGRFVPRIPSELEETVYATLRMSPAGEFDDTFGFAHRLDGVRVAGS